MHILKKKKTVCQGNSNKKKRFVIILKEIIDSKTVPFRKHYASKLSDGIKLVLGFAQALRMIVCDSGAKKLASMISIIIVLLDNVTDFNIRHQGFCSPQFYFVDNGAEKDLIQKRKW